MLRNLLDLLLPDHCCNCQKTGQILCQSCADDIIYEPFGRCVACNRPTEPSQLCYVCRGSMADAWVVGSRDGVLETLTDLSKFQASRSGCLAQAELLDRCLPLLPAKTIIVPIPTIAPHIRQRGYGHTELIATELARRRGYVASRLLRRTNSSVQHGASRQQRQRQAAKAFALPAAPPTESPILLIDDVYTTGATIQAAVKRLRTATKQPIYVAITARQLLD